MRADMIPLLMLRMLTGSSASGYSWTLVTSSTVNFRGFLDEEKTDHLVTFYSTHDEPFKSHYGLTPTMTTSKHLPPVPELAA